MTKVLLGLVLSPLIGFGVGFLLHKLSSRMLMRARPSVNGAFVAASG